MNGIFSRTRQVGEKIHELKLRLAEWKVLFAVDGAMDTEALASLLEMDTAQVDSILKSLQKMGLVEALGEEAPVEEKPVEEVAPEKPEIESTEEEKPPIPVETTEEKPEEKSIPEEEVTETEKAEEEELDEIFGDLFEEETGAGEKGVPSGEKVTSKTESQPSPSEVITEEDLEMTEMLEQEAQETEEELEEFLEEMEEGTTTEEVVTEAPPGEVVEKLKTIMVVDDSVVIRKMVEIALENETSYKVVSIGNGKDALNYLDDHRPDLIILDIMLPDVNGLDILRAIRANEEIKDIPVLMLSAKDTPRETAHARELGANGFIPKPFKDEELLGKIKELLGD